MWGFEPQTYAMRPKAFFWWSRGELNSKLVNANDLLYRLTTTPKIHKIKCSVLVADLPAPLVEMWGLKPRTPTLPE